MAIDIKQLNQDYTQEKSTLAILNAPGGLKDKIEQGEIALHQLKKDYLVYQADLEWAKAKNDITQAIVIEQKLEGIKQSTTTLKQRIEQAKTNLSEQQKRVDSKIEELSKDPETKKKLDSILYKKYDRKRKVELDKKKQLETIKEIANNHPTVKKLLTGIEGYNKTIKSCNRIISNLGTKSPLTPKETADLAKARADLPVAQSKLNDRKRDLVNYFAINHPLIDAETLKGLHSYGDISKQMQGCDKTIANCTKAMSGLTVSQGLKNFTNSDPSLPTIAENKPSWLHPIKRIKYNINARRARKEAEAQSQISKNNQRKAFKNELKLSKDEYSADIVQKYLENYEKGLHEAAKSNRGNGNSR